MSFMYQFQIDVGNIVSFLAVVVALVAVFLSRKDRRTDAEKKADDAERQRNIDQHNALDRKIEELDTNHADFKRDITDTLVKEIKEYRAVMDEKLSDVYDKQNKIKDNYLDRFARQAALTTSMRDEIIERFHAHEIKVIERLDDMKTTLTTHK